MGIVPKTEIIGDSMKIPPLLDQATGHHGPILPEEILGIHTNGFVESDLKIQHRDAKTLCYTINHKALVMRNFHDLTTIPVNDLIPLPVKKIIGAWPPSCKRYAPPTIASYGTSGKNQGIAWPRPTEIVTPIALRLFEGFGAILSQTDLVTSRQTEHGVEVSLSSLSLQDGLQALVTPSFPDGPEKNRCL